MVMKPFRPSCYMFLFAFLDLTVHNVQLHSYHFELTITICEQKTKDCAQSGRLQPKLQHRTVVFNFDVCRLS